MAAGQVDHVDVVAHAGAVMRGVVVAEDVQLLQLADGDLGDVGHEVVGDVVGVLADEAALVGADGVEVAQQRDVQARVGLAVVHQDALDEELGGAVGVGGAAGREVLADGHGGGVAVHGGGGGEHEVLHAVVAHGVEYHEGVAQGCWCSTPAAWRRSRPRPCSPAKWITASMSG